MNPAAVGDRLAVVLLHGYDSRPGAWVPFVEELQPLLADDVDIHLLTGPVSLDESSTGSGPSFAWFDDGQDLFPTVAQAVAWVRSRLVGRCVLVGFSQGGAVALGCAFAPSESDRRQVAGVVAIGSFLPDDVSPVEFGGPLVVVHGEDDPVVDVMFGERLHRQAAKAGITAELHLHPGGHHVPASAAGLVAELVGNLMAGYA